MPLKSLRKPTEVPPDSPGFYSNVFLVWKSTGGWRPVIDLKNLNSHIQVLLRHQAQLLNTLDLVGFILNPKKSELDLTQDLQFLGIHLRLDLGKALLPGL